MHKWWGQGNRVAPEDMETWDGLLRMERVRGRGHFCLA